MMKSLFIDVGSTFVKYAVTFTKATYYPKILSAHFVNTV